MAGRENEAIAVHPRGVGGVVPQGLAVQEGPELRAAQGKARMAGIGLLDGVHREDPGAQGYFLKGSDIHDSSSIVVFALGRVNAFRHLLNGRTQMAKRDSAGAGKIESGDLRALLIRSPRRTVSLQVNPDLSLVMKAPSDTPEPFLRDFLERRRPWVERHLARMARIKAAAPAWEDGGRVPFLGAELELRVETGARARARLSGGRVIATARDPADPEEARIAVERLFAREAAVRFPAMLDECLAKAARRRARREAPREFPRPELRVRTMRSRWGSCDAKAGVVTLNSRLLRFRPEVIECVIMHELAHFRYRKHGPRFYGLLAELCPDYETLQAELADVYLE